MVRVPDKKELSRKSLKPHDTGWREIQFSSTSFQRKAMASLVASSGSGCHLCSQREGLCIRPSQRRIDQETAKDRQNGRSHPRDEARLFAGLRRPPDARADGKPAGPG